MLLVVMSDARYLRQIDMRVNIGLVREVVKQYSVDYHKAHPPLICPTHLQTQPSKGWDTLSCTSSSFYHSEDHQVSHP